MIRSIKAVKNPQVNARKAGLVSIKPTLTKLEPDDVQRGLAV